MELLLLISALVAMLVKRLHVPYCVGLVTAGIGLAFLPIKIDVELTRELIFNALLPPLVFEAALYIRWPELRKDFLVILVLATLGVLLSASLTAVGMHYLAGWQWASAAVFGILISATDPVSVIATFKELGTHGRLRLLVETESLFNDATAAVAFGVALLFATGGGITASAAAATLFATIIGGLLCGFFVGGGSLLLAGQTDDSLVEITFTTIAAFGSFFLAEHFHASGVIASLTAGILVGNLGPLGAFSDKGRPAVLAFWDYIAFVANSLIFILIGLREAHESFQHVIATAIIATGLVLLGRAFAVYPCCALFQLTSLSVDVKHQHILVWGGLRGALALALALGLPYEVPQRNDIITVSFAVVSFSIFVQGMTIESLVRKLGKNC
ncbi:MAG TPA: cation:proton antiporter [Dissulfurispiraceae bacterium]|nr:cation:proton antiporter [Dissulfurispiraceae bacterium]